MLSYLLIIRTSFYEKPASQLRYIIIRQNPHLATYSIIRLIILSMMIRLFCTCSVVARHYLFYYSSVPTFCTKFPPVSLLFNKQHIVHNNSSLWLL
jgi:hypothetical protein